MILWPNPSWVLRVEIEVVREVVLGVALGVALVVAWEIVWEVAWEVAWEVVWEVAWEFTWEILWVEFGCAEFELRYRFFSRGSMVAKLRGYVRGCVRGCMRDFVSWVWLCWVWGEIWIFFRGEVWLQSWEVAWEVACGSSLVLGSMITFLLCSFD